MSIISKILPILASASLSYYTPINLGTPPYSFGSTYKKSQRKRRKKKRQLNKK